MLILLAVAVSLLATCCNNPTRPTQQQVVLVPFLVSSFYDDDHNNSNNNENNNSHAAIVFGSELLQLQQEEGEDEEEPPEHQGEEEDEPSNNTNSIPPIIWMFWDDGWPASNPEANLALYSFRHCSNNNDRSHDDTNDTAIQKWTIRPIDTITAERYSRRKRYIPDDDFFFSNLTVQARSDVYRTLLLYRYGGIWADASLFCNVPIAEWLEDLQPNNNTDLISLVRHDNKMQQRQLDIAPWITSWFLASPPRGYTISRLVEQYLMVVDNDDEDSTVPPKQQKQHARLTTEYFWWHRMISELARTDERVAANIRTLGSADPSHCHTNDNNTTTVPLYKRCKNKPMYAVMATTRYCCDTNNNGAIYDDFPPPPQQQQQGLANITDDDNSTNMTNTTTTLFDARMQSLCAIWNCTGRPTDHLVQYGGNNSDRIATAWGTNDLSYFQSLFAHG
jgi:hypothetical protein